MRHKTELLWYPDLVSFEQHHVVFAEDGQEDD